MRIVKKPLVLLCFLVSSVFGHDAEKVDFRAQKAPKIGPKWTPESIKMREKNDVEKNMIFENLNSSKSKTVNLEIDKF